MQIYELKNLIKEVIVESSLSRINQHISEHDCATITAFRNDPSDHSNCATGYHAPSRFQDEGLSAYDINIRNNKFLKAALLSKGFGVTAIDGSYIENFKSTESNSETAPVEVREDSLFVVNLNNIDQVSFFDIITELGKKYCQDSVLLIPKGGEEGAFLRGTNNSWPGLGIEVPHSKIGYGKEREFMSKVRNRPFSAINEELETYDKLSGKQRMAVKGMAHKVFGK